MISRHPLASDAFISVGYDPQHSIMEIEMADGALYRYHGVPDNVYEDLRTAVDKEAFFEKEIKPFYRTERLTGIGKAPDEV